MKVKTLKRFFDLKEQELRKPNDEFVVSKERADELNSSALGLLVKEIEEKKRVSKKKSGE